MDIWFTLFVCVTAIAAAVGFSLILVGYIGVMPASLGHGGKWLWSVGIVPFAIIVAPVFINALVALAGYGMPQGELAKWAAIPAAAVHAMALLWFVSTHWESSAKPGRQLGIGILLVALAGATLYGFGPHFVERILAGVK